MNARVALALVWLLLSGCGAALAHASLTGSDPVDGAVTATAPTRFVLTFDEPVSPLVLTLVDDRGRPTALDRYRLDGSALVIEAPAGLAAGTHALNWRVVSVDGHPIGGTVVFSVGAPSLPAMVAAESVDARLRAAIWAARVALYAGLLFGIGGLFFDSFLAQAPRHARRVAVAALLAAALALPVSVGLQGLDALALPLQDLVRAPPWAGGFGTSYGTAAILFAAAIAAALAGIALRARRARRIAAIAALVALCAGFASTGHASAAAPQWLTRPAVFIHLAALAVWIGALVPLGLSLRAGSPPSAALKRFSQIAPAAVVALAVAGAVLAIVQMQTPQALWTTAYGRVLAAKLALLVPLFVLAAVNRWRLTRPADAGDPPARRALARSIAAEVAIVVAILGVVAIWRFTPPPRTLVLAAAGPASVHIHTARAMAELTFTPGHAGPVAVSISVLDGEFGMLVPKEVSLTLSKPDAGIEQIRRAAKLDGDGTWRVDDLTLPVSGRWDVDVALLISEFELLHLRDRIDIR